MWQPLHSTLPYYLLFTQDKNIDITITNFVKTWTVQYNVNEFISCLKENNLALEIDANEIFANGITLLSEPKKLKTVDVTFEQEHLKVAVSRNFGYPLKLVIKLRLASDEKFFKIVTQSLLKTIQDLRSSETELRNLLKCKDKEIDEYKAEAGEICLRYLKTKPFNDVAHMEKHTLYDIHFGSSDISDTFLVSVDSFEENVVKQEYVQKIDIKNDLANRQNNIKTEPDIEQNNIKTESAVEHINIKKEPSAQVLQMEMQVIPDDVKQKMIKTEPSIAPKKRKIKLNI